MRLLSIQCWPLVGLLLEAAASQECQHEGAGRPSPVDTDRIMTELASLKESLGTRLDVLDSRLDNIETRLDNLSVQIESEKEFGVQRAQYLHACTASIGSKVGTSIESGIMTLLQFPECGCTYLASALHVAKNLRTHESFVGGQAWHNKPRIQWDFERLDVWVSTVNEAELNATFPLKVPCKVHKPYFRVGEKIAIYSPAHVVKISLGVVAGEEKVAFSKQPSGATEPILRPHGYAESSTTKVLLCSADLFAGFSGSAVSNHEILGIAVAEVDCGAYQGGPDTRRCTAVVPSQTILEELKQQNGWCPDFC